jgi:DNA repair exonuclease SbcCD ATPase subunit
MLDENTIRDLSVNLATVKAQRDTLLNEKKIVRKKLKNIKKEIDNLEEAQYILTEVAKLVQQEMVFHITEISNLALQAIFDEPYKLQVTFDTKRNQSECDIRFVRNGSDIDPLDAAGGGVIDIVTLALRISLWSLNKDRLVPVLIFDEPLKNLSANYQDLAGKILHEITQKLGLQIIMVTHVEPFTEFSDNTVEIKNTSGISKTRRLT